MSLESYKLYFNKCNCIYRPGDILAGNVEVQYNSAKVIRGIFIEISGKATVSWTEKNFSDSDSDISSYKKYKNKERFLKIMISVLGTGNPGTRIEIPPGKQVLPFQYILPTNLPPTFKGKYGKIQYKVKAILDCPWKSDKHIKTPLFIETLSSLQNHPYAKKSGLLVMQKEFGIIFISNPLTVIIRTPHSGFARGQVIQMQLEVHNKSNTALNGISVKLKQITTYRKKDKTKIEEKTLTKNAQLFKIKPNTSASVNHSIRVPIDLILHDLSNCNIINIDYGIRVELLTAGWSSNLIGHMALYPITTTL